MPRFQSRFTPTQKMRNSRARMQRFLHQRIRISRRTAEDDPCTSVRCPCALLAAHRRSRARVADVRSPRRDVAQYFPIVFCCMSDVQKNRVLSHCHQRFPSGNACKWITRRIIIPNVLHSTRNAFDGSPVETLSSITRKSIKTPSSASATCASSTPSSRTRKPTMPSSPGHGNWVSRSCRSEACERSPFSITSS